MLYLVNISCLVLQKKKKRKPENADIACLMYKIMKNSKYDDALPISFHRNTDTCQGKSTKTKWTRRNYQAIISSQDVFDFVEHQEKDTYGLGNKLTFEKNNDNFVITWWPGVGAIVADGLAANRAFEQISDIMWYIPQFNTIVLKRNYWYSSLQLDQQQN